MLLIMLLWLPVVFGFCLLNFFLGQSSDAEGVTICRTTLLVFTIFPFPTLYVLLNRWLRGAEQPWSWMISVVLSGLLAGELADFKPSIASIPQFNSYRIGTDRLTDWFSLISDAGSLGERWITFVDIGLAFSVVWLAGVLYFAPVAKLRLLSSNLLSSNCANHLTRNRPH